MLEIFAQMTPNWFYRAFVYTGSVGPRFRFRCEQGKDAQGAPLLYAAVYSDVCYELAADVERRDFSWDEEGAAALRAWFQERYDAFAAAHPAS